MKTTPEITKAAEAVRLIGEAFRRSRQLVEQVVRDYGITAAQYGILIRLEQAPGMSRVDVARQNFISPQAAQVAITTLERKGLVSSRSLGNGNRAMGTYLTAEGTRVVEACRVANVPALEQFIAPLSAKELDLFIGLLRRCTDAPTR